MARQISSGFELNSTTSGVEPNIEGSESSPSIVSTTIRSGSYSLQIASLTSGNKKGVRQYLSENSPSKYVRIYYNVATLPSAENRIIAFKNQNSFSDPAFVYITIDNTGVLKLYDEDGQIGSASSALSLNTNYRIELFVDTTGAAGSHTVQARIDGVQFAGATNRSIAGGIRHFFIGGNLNGEAQTTGSWSFDDFAFNTASGSFQNSWPGPGKVIHLKPNAAGDNNALEGAASTNYQDVDEVTPDDATTNIDTAADSVGEIDDYNIENPTSIGENDTINCVQIGVRHAGAGASSNDSFVVRVKASASGTVEESAAISPSGTAYRTNNNNIRDFLLTLYDLPGASTTAWTKADLTTAQIGIRKSADSTNGARISTLWMLVDYTPVLVNAGNYALSFDGSDDRVTVNDHNFDGLSAGTIEFFVKSSHTSSYQKIIQKSSAIDIGISQNFGGGAKLFGEVISVGNLGELEDANHADGNWHHVAFSWDGSFLRGYIDGVYKKRVAQSGTQGNSTNIMYIGEKDDGSEPLNGLLDEFRISNTARYTTETSFTVPTAEFTDDANTLVLLHFNENAGTVAGDESGYENLGYLNGPTYVEGYFVVGGEEATPVHRLTLLGVS